jgi:hypothetical protein
MDGWMDGWMDDTAVENIKLVLVLFQIMTIKFESNELNKFGMFWLFAY